MPDAVSPVWNFFSTVTGALRSAGCSTRNAYGTRRCTPFPRQDDEAVVLARRRRRPLAVTVTGMPVKPPGASVNVAGTSI